MTESLYVQVLDFFALEFATLQERVASGELAGYGECAVVSRRIVSAMDLLTAHLQSEPRLSVLATSASALAEQLSKPGRTSARPLASAEAAALYAFYRADSGAQAVGSC